VSRRLGRGGGAGEVGPTRELSPRATGEIERLY
jgi:hypothetical protein